MQRFFPASMRIVPLVWACLFLLSSNSLMAQSEAELQRQWQQIQDQLSQNQLQTAYQSLQDFTETAKESGNDPWIVKGLLETAQVQGRILENSDSAVVATITAEIEAAPPVRKAVLKSALAGAYQSYLNGQLWKIMERTDTDEQPADFQTWGLATFYREITQLYLQSLEPVEELRAIPTAEWKPITKGLEASARYRPTLYDLLAYRATEEFQNMVSNQPLSENVYSLTPEQILIPAAEFVKVKLPEPASSNVNYDILIVFQEWLSNLLTHQSAYAIGDADLLRLAFAKQLLGTPEADLQYLATCSYETQFNYGHPVKTRYRFVMAQDWVNKARAVDLLNPDDPNREGFAKAMELIEENIEEFPGSRGSELSKRLKSEILAHELRLGLEAINLPDQPFRGNLQYRNLERVYFRVIPLDNRLRERIRNSRDRAPLIAKAKYIESGIYTLPAGDDHFPHRTEVALPKLEPGNYIVAVSDNTQFSADRNAVSWTDVEISNLTYQLTSDTGMVTAYLLDRLTGKPISGAKVEVEYRGYSFETRKNEVFQRQTLTTDKLGKVEVPESEDQRRYIVFKFQHGDDEIKAQAYGDSRRDEIRPKSRNVIFTDRKIYRPGQPIHVKVLVFQQQDESSANVLPNSPIQIIFRDANGQEIEQTDLKTNEYGSVTHTFTAPTGGLTGAMTIWTPFGSTSVSVEEYKRPTFEVTFEEADQPWKLNDEVKVKGKAMAFSGAPIGASEVRYTVTRKASFPFWWGGFGRRWRPMPRSKAQQVASGTIRTGSDGTFELSFPAIPDGDIDPSFKPIFRYEVHADVVDISGETRSGDQVVRLGYASVLVEMKVPSYLLKEDLPKAKILTTDLNGNPQSVSGTLSIVPVITPEINFRKRLWEQPDQHLYSEQEYRKMFPRDVYANEQSPSAWKDGQPIMEAQVTTSEDFEFELSALTAAPAGRYKLIFVTDEDSLRTEQLFTLDQSFKKRPPVPTWLDIQMSQETAKVGDTVIVQLVSTEPQLHVRCRLGRNRQVLEDRWVDLQGKFIWKIPIEEAYRGDVVLTFNFAAQNESHLLSKTIQVPWTNKELTLKWETFRSELQPGQEETWRLRITGPEAEAVSAELVASLYDASLDEFRANDFDLNVYASGGYIRQVQVGDYNTRYTSTISKDWNPRYRVPRFEYDRLELGLNLLGMQFLFAKNERAMMASPSPSMVAGSAPAEFGDDSGGALQERAQSSEQERKYNGDLLGNGNEGGNPNEVGHSEPSTPPMASRTNLSETAFFFPQIRTNEDGEVVLEFTMPEALTRWKFLGFAHTPDMKFGTLTSETVTQKDLMVVPNVPRFLREGDEIKLVAKIVNMSDVDQSGKAYIKILKASDMTPIESELVATDTEVSIDIPAGESVSVDWAVNIPMTSEAYVVQMMASTGEHTDGEEHLLPVLSNRTLVTESLPFSLFGKEKKKRLKFGKLLAADESETLTHERVTLEVTANPIWTAVQSLPYLMEYPHECAEQIFSRYYANTLAAQIANSNPKLQAVFREWEAAGADTDAMMSNLETNQELKAVLLEETPWVMEAQSQAERKKRIATLFDLERIGQESRAAEQKLTQMQNPNGSFSWFPGMRDNRYITQLIATGFGQLNHLGIQTSGNPEINSMVSQAVAYLDQEAVKYYREIQERDEPEAYVSSSLDIQYLFMRSLHQEQPLSADAQTAFQFYYDHAKEKWTDRGQQAQGMLALVFHRYEDQELAETIVRGLRETSVINSNQGMYWKGLGGYHWYQSPIETQAMMIETFHEVAKDLESVEQLKVWLLENKRTNDWGTTRATVAACYALLMTGPSGIESQSSVEVRIGDYEIYPKKLEETQPEAGTGYFKESWEGSEITSDMGEIAIRRQGKGLTYGAVYWQYFEDLDKITGADTPLKLEKELMIERNTPQGPKLVAVSPDNPIRTGDKVVARVVLRVDRDLEYVHLKDLRAAGMEPVEVLSSYRFTNGLGYYQSTRDAATHFFFDRLRKGTWVFEYPLRATLAGDFSAGIATIQCMYAPEFSAHSAGIRVEIE
ncbi:alpha-2-macroglobulin family protein [Pontibacter sp. G13]|uniref:alpha-2-macroglobulin family protein n=1 Tax=Pontibacter sp. G13 TaxID=3074898 RepID=UPI00288AFCD9|nr:alpha-2-macroglobulin family protein [Pontibacter sp. G13]WNJ17408.1 alpha-2-macroglobulin family protein [Pontibacter sp. G13]